MVTTISNPRWDHDPLTELVLGAAFEVHNILGAGFLEKVYERALMREFDLRGLRAEQQVSCSVRYKGLLVGDYQADVIVDGRLLLELKCVDRLAQEHVAQCLNYLKATGLETCLLLNFQRPRLEIRRISRSQHS